MGVVGLLVAMVINIFVQSTALQLAISFIGVLIFAGLTAYDTQRIKSMYAYVAGTGMMGKTVIMGALRSEERRGERVCQDVYSSVVAGPFQKKKVMHSTSL